MELEQLHELLTDRANFPEPRSCAVSGIGGVGKTQVALEYTYKYRACYQAIFWLRTENSVELLKSYSAIGYKLGIVDDTNDGRRVSRIADWLENTGEYNAHGRFHSKAIDKVR